METTLIFTSGEATGKMVIKKDDGSVAQKEILNSTILEAFQNASTIDEYYAVPSLLQKYVPSVEGLLYGCKEPNLVKGIFFVPGDTRYMNFSKEQFIIPYPSCLFVLEATNGQLVSSHCYCTAESKMDDLKEDTRLFAFPFGNVQPSDGYICWGTNHLGVINSYSDLKNAIITFFSSETNSDYVTKGSSFQGYKNYRSFLSALGRLKKFPAKALVPSFYCKTVGSLLDNFINVY